MYALVHTSSGFAALGLGAAVLFRRKGTRQHRVLGAAYVISMIILNVSAFTIVRLFGGFGIFHLFALLSLVSLSCGVAVVAFRRPRSNWLYFHYQWMAWSYTGLLGATINEAFVHIDWLSAYARAPTGSPVLVVQLVFFTLATILINTMMFRIVPRYVQSTVP